MKIWLSIPIAIIAGLAVGLLLTELLNSTIYFSLFIGMPAGIITMIAVFLLLK